MANTITGRIYKITPTESIATKKGTTFTKRQLVIDATRYDQYTGEKKFDNFPAFEVGGEELCKQLDGYHNNELVTVSFDLNGREFVDENNVTKYFTSVRAYKVERVQRVQYEQADRQDSAQQTAATQQPTAAPENVAATRPTHTMAAGVAQNNDLPF